MEIAAFLVFILRGPKRRDAMHRVSTLHHLPRTDAINRVSTKTFIYVFLSI